jgi:DNA-binding transcriptional LysR family regulator
MVRKTRSGSSRPIDLRALEVFVTVAETGNMTIAARKLSMTQPAISQIFRHLENDVGSPLLDRELRPLRLTPAGVALFARAKQLLSDAERLYQEIHLAADAVLPRLRLGLVDSFAVTAGPPLIKSMQSEIEQLLVWSGIAPELREELINRDLDMIICPDALDGVEGVESKRLLHESYVVVLPAALKRQAANLSLADLAARFPLIRFSNRSLIGAQIDRHLRWLRIDVPKRNEFDSSESVAAMVAEGVGWAIMTPLALAQAPTTFPRIAVMPLPGPELSRALYLVHRTGEFGSLPERIATRCSQILRDTVASKLQQFTPWLIEHFIID